MNTPRSYPPCERNPQVVFGLGVSAFLPRYRTTELVAVKCAVLTGGGVAREIQDFRKAAQAGLPRWSNEDAEINEGRTS